MSEKQRQTPVTDGIVDAAIGLSRGGRGKQEEPEPEPESELPPWQEKKRQRDAERARLWLDVPDWLRVAIEQESSAQKMSMSQISAFLIAHSLKLLRDGDPEITDLFETCKARIAHLRWHYTMDLTDLETALTKSAKSEERHSF